MCFMINQKLSYGLHHSNVMLDGLELKIIYQFNHLFELKEMNEFYHIFSFGIQPSYQSFRSLILLLVVKQCVLHYFSFAFHEYL